MRRLQLLSALALINGVRWIVPRRLRARWIAEWRGELWYLWKARSSQTAATNDHAPSGVFSRSLSSIPHATALARQEWTPDMLVQDIWYAVRRLSGNPGFVLIAVLTIAIGVGANTAIFSVINSTLINPLPYPDANRIVYLWSLIPASDFMVTPGGEDVRAWREQMTSFEEMEVWATKHVTLTGEGEPVDLAAALASQRLFAFLGLQPSHGRGFSVEEARDDARVVVISDGFWRRRLGGIADVLGYQLLLSGEPHEIIGVLPRSYVAHAPFFDTEIFLPLTDDKIDEAESPVAVGRLKRGITAQAANAEFEALAAGSTADGEPDAATRVGHAMRPQEMVGDNFRTSLFTLQAAVGFVLLIACANVANLLLARGTAQQREMAVRAAMGAGRGRLLRQLLAENLLLAIAGGLLGYGLARLGVTVLIALRPESMQNLETIRVDPSMLWFALGVSVLTGIVFGLLPAMQGSRPDVLDQLKDATRSGTPSSRRVSVRNMFVVAEVALSIVLLVGAGLLLSSLGRLLTSDIGFDPHNVLAMSLDLPKDRYPEAAGRMEFRRQLEEGVALAAGDRIESMAVASYPPPRGGVWFSTFAPEGGDPTPSLEKVPIFTTWGSPGYIETLRISLVHGRDFVPGDEEDESNPVIVSAEWARRMWGDERVAGRRFSAQGRGAPTLFSVVGVIDDPRLTGPVERYNDLLVLQPQDTADAALSILVRAEENPLAFVETLKQQVWAIDPDVPIGDVALVEDLMAGTLAPQRFNAILVTLAAGVALSLALIGLYGVLSYSVGQRTREIGIRMALGAERSHIVPMVAWQGMRLVLIGVFVGIVSALALGRLIESLLYEVGAFDSLTYASVVAVFAFVSTLACLVPATRAARSDPMLALQSE